MAGSKKPFGDGRYSRQQRFSGIGEAGQGRLRTARVAVIGCGGLGSTVITLLARAGIGSLVIVDRDVVEYSNLHRQLLYDEADAEATAPKAIAAAAAIGRINSDVRVRAVVADVTPGSVESIVEDALVVVDATDNLQTRYLINDACVRAGIPWVYGGAVGSAGMAMTIVPGRTPCFRCLFPDPPPAGGVDSCDTVGVLASNVVTVAAYQWTEAVKLIVGAREQVTSGLVTLDVWTGDHDVVSGIQRRPDCRCCAANEFDFLRVERAGLRTEVLGRHAVQVSPDGPTAIDLAGLGGKLPAAQVVACNEHVLRFLVAGDRELTAFPDGRVIVNGTADPDEAAALYYRYVRG
jgi:adenylyltransferase/sulfurtransferase